jgi:hypothetical protein
MQEPTWRLTPGHWLSLVQGSPTWSPASAPPLEEPDEPPDPDELELPEVASAEESVDPPDELPEDAPASLAASSPEPGGGEELLLQAPQSKRPAMVKASATGPGRTAFIGGMLFPEDTESTPRRLIGSPHHERRRGRG